MDDPLVMLRGYVFGEPGRNPREIAECAILEIERLRKGVDDEREACAKIAEDYNYLYDEEAIAVEAIAKAIRSRSNSAT